ncbi:two-component system, NtrC family, nitrogen regulation response regulator GlnG [Desulfuromusa kysingii]|uniref:DNA-binding transcriptional regulator NtrC n=1 Tax=Desulfuromusa kysingii TaxID=37625 RepID=A0A1H4DZ63_9BACT|nr:sigma-54 dependent transcriptional regulator [Desulfuromusa kysingii]SEA77472.1 two-component system, NtrC family, nitrogen regulation response regulator GlnG [Desulfuromusa kysingii]
MNKILIVDDEKTVRYAFKRTFEDEYEISEAENGKEALTLLEQDPPNVVLMDIRMPVMDGLTALSIIKQKALDIQVVLMTAYTDTETAMQAMKEGAFDYIIKPFDNAEIRQIIQKACHLSRIKGKVENTSEKTVISSKTDHIIGCSRSIIAVSKLVGQVAPTELPALILGETGAGKELVARAIVQHSVRAKGPFMVVNCASLPDTLIESELFGYESGAFTGATKQRVGRFEQCQDGTIFLDEIGELPVLMQAKVLRVLQDGSFERLGGSHTLYSNARVIAATNCDLEKMVAKGEFRRDLYHRLKVFPIHIPALRERQEDIPLLVNYFISRYGQEIDPPIEGITQEAIDKLVEYSWPGNVRELQNVLRRAIVLARSSTVTVDDCQLDVSVPADQKGAGSIDALIDESFKDGGNSPFQQVVSQVECALIKKALALSQGNQVKAAKLLGINRVTLRKKIQLYSC